MDESSRSPAAPENGSVSPDFDNAQIFLDNARKAYQAGDKSRFESSVTLVKLCLELPHENDPWRQRAR